MKHARPWHERHHYLREDEHESASETWFGILLLVIVLALGFFTGRAMAATASEWLVDLTKSDTLVQTVKGATLDAAVAGCEAIIPKTTTGAYLCEEPRKSITVTPDPPVNCVVSAWSDWTGGTWSACANGTQTRTETRTRTITTQPANGGTACPVLTESRTASQPCAITPTWTRCADEWGFCAFTGPRAVRYGSGTTWVEHTITGNGTLCTNDVFGDPLPNVVKRCEISGEATPPPVTGSALITITTPTANVTPAGYRLYYGTAPDTLTQTVEMRLVPTYTVQNLPAGTWYFAVKAYTQSAESAFSNIGSKVIR